MYFKRPNCLLFLTTHKIYLDLSCYQLFIWTQGLLLFFVFVFLLFLFSIFHFFTIEIDLVLQQLIIFYLSMRAVGDVFECFFFTQPKFQLPQIKGKFALTRALLQPKIRWSFISLGSGKKIINCIRLNRVQGIHSNNRLVIWLSG